ncbi:hypothetical protein E2320_022021 [Naja naja]|nr:hypothetical protein E2320_022021 [Naja naja]
MPSEWGLKQDRLSILARPKVNHQVLLSRSEFLFSQNSLHLKHIHRPSVYWVDKIPKEQLRYTIPGKLIRIYVPEQRCLDCDLHVIQCILLTALKIPVDWMGQHFQSFMKDRMNAESFALALSIMTSRQEQLSEFKMVHPRYKYNRFSPETSVTPTALDVVASPRLNNLSRPRPVTDISELNNLNWFMVWTTFAKLLPLLFICSKPLGSRALYQKCFDIVWTIVEMF